MSASNLPLYLRFIFRRISIYLQVDFNMKGSLHLSKRWKKVQCLNINKHYSQARNKIHIFKVREPQKTRPKDVMTSTLFCLLI